MPRPPVPLWIISVGRFKYCLLREDGGFWNTIFFNEKMEVGVNVFHIWLIPYFGCRRSGIVVRFDDFPIVEKPLCAAVTRLQHTRPVDCTVLPVLYSAAMLFNNHLTCECILSSKLFTDRHWAIQQKRGEKKAPKLANMIGMKMIATAKPRCLRRSGPRLFQCGVD